MASTASEWARNLADRAVARAREDQARREARRDAGRRAAVRLAEALAAEPGVRRVILFGSLAGPGGLVHEDSDIDLAVEGLPAARQEAVGWRLEDLAGMPVDLVRLEDAAPGLRASIESDGETLHVQRVHAGVHADMERWIAELEAARVEISAR